jgi:hypothetical protein
MKHFISKVKPDGHDNFVRLFKRVMANRELTPLQKIILSDIISLQIQGKRYFKTSKALSTELGNVTKKAIQDNFQKLNRMGYLDCVPFKSSPEETYSLREAIVVDIEKWTADSETYDRLNLDAMKPEVKDKNHPVRMAWPNRFGEKEPSATLDRNINPEILVNTKEVEKAEVSKLPIIHVEHINHSYSIRDAIRSEIRRGTEPNFFKATIDFDDLGMLEDVVVKVNDKTNPQLTHMRKEFIFEDWSPDASTSLEDDLLDASENLD